MRAVDGHPRVLLIAAQRGLRTGLARELSDRGCAVTGCASAHEAFSRGLAHKPDLVLLDAALPLLPAETVMTTLRYHFGRGLPILLLSGSEAGSDLSTRVFAQLQQLDPTQARRDG